MTRRRAQLEPDTPEGLPSRERLLQYLREAGGEAKPGELAQAFGLKGPERTDLRRLLRDLEREGALERGAGRRFRKSDTLPAVTVLDVTTVDDQGDAIALPARRDGDGPDTPRVRLSGERPGRRAPGVGDRVLAKLRLTDDGYEGAVIRVLPKRAERAVGVLEQVGRELRLRTAERGGGTSVIVQDRAVEAAPGDLVLAEIDRTGRLGLARARIVERFGRADEPSAISLLAAEEAGIRLGFPAEAQSLADAAQPVGLGDRVDLRDLPLVTIDGEDARDFDDAVFAEPDPDAADGFRLTVAIADVAWYVRPGDALDREASLRGNSVYFPDRVVPMLPEALSADLCSLRPHEDRACLAVQMRIGPEGEVRAHRFGRGLMRSAARLTYAQAQAANDGASDETTGPLMDRVVRPLFAAWEALERGRAARGTLDLDLPEMQVVTDERSYPVTIAPRPRLNAHRLIELFMIAANVAAAETIEGLHEPCMYRVHDKPDPVKIEALTQFLQSLGERTSGTGLRTPADFLRLLQRFRGHELAPMLNGFVLRCQSQAAYAPDNIGHFGLALKRYAHFTSPIRRYADLLVHRALITGLKLGEGGLAHDVGRDVFSRVGEHISGTERAAMAAERRAVDRFVSLYLAERVGAVFDGWVGSVQRFGLFVRLTDLGVDGLVPVSTLGEEWFHHEPAAHVLVGERTGQIFGLGDRVRVELLEADPVSGSLALRLLECAPGPAARRWKETGGKRSRRPPRPTRPTGRRSRSR